MRLSPGWKLPPVTALFLALLCGCPHPQRVAPAAPEAVPPAAPVPGAPGTPAPHLGTPHDILPQSSLLTLLVYRGGALASAGHNHVIASHDLSGTIYVSQPIAQSSFEVHVPVASLTVDEAVLRAQQPPAEFPADVSDSAKAGTRRNMLGEALLDAGQHPEIVLRSLQLEATPGAADSGTVMAQVQSSVRGQLRSFTVPVRYRLGTNGMVEASGEFPLRQTDLGLTPFSAMLGALQVQDEMRVSFHILAQAAPHASGPRS
ncbi:MAG: YceI family protein [Sinobacteraceae bacterium]|nr:YceI family protein [Nevskiaceae bacterium]MBV9316718.1 YceI family protein [Gammaproteobacteria bacterium]